MIEAFKEYLKINHEVPPGKTDEGFGVISNMGVHARRPKNISELEVLC